MPEISSAAPARRYTVGFLPQLASGFGGFQDVVWRSMVEAARGRGVNALVFAGGSIDTAAYNPYEKNLNLVYELISRTHLDGLVINYTIGNYVSRERFLEFCRQFSLPLVSIIGAVEGFPHVRVDNKKSMRDVILHLAVEHHLKKIAFIRGTAGNPDAEERYGVYRETLLELGIPYDPDLVFNGIFQEESGTKAVDFFLKEKGKFLQAVVASNDAMAFGAINRLRELGKRVPWDVTVTGFDDTDEAMAYTPALTTVRQPFDEICSQALAILCRMIEGEHCADAVAVPARMVVRQSCGCSSALLMKSEAAAPAPAVAHGGFAAGELAGITDVIVQELMQASVDTDRAMLAGVVEEFILDVQNEHPGAFLDKLKMILQEKIIQRQEVHTWQHALYILRKWAGVLWTEEKPAADAENRILQACVLVGESNKQALAYQKILIEKKAKDLREVGQEFITTFDFERLRDVIRRQLVRLSIDSFFISLFKNREHPGREAEAYLAVRSSGKGAPDSGGEGDGDMPQYAVHALPEKEFFPSDRRYAFAVHPLCFKERKLGYVMFELGPEDGMTYDTLQVQISSSLMGSELIRQMEKAEAIQKKKSDSIQALIRPMLDSIGAVTDTAREKIGLLGDLTAVTKENGEKMNSTNAAIKSMSEKIVKMSDVVGLIDDISSRVNILAINTSIESAHAGDFGKGFAVIAGEIRKLADSIKDNATVIAEYLKDIRPTIDISRKAGNESQEAFRKLEKDVLGVAQTLQLITRSMNDLSTGSSQIMDVMNSSRE